jgi:hypothetical protein
MTPNKAAFERLHQMTSLASGRVWCTMSENYSGWVESTKKQYSAGIIHNDEHFHVVSQPTAEKAADAVIDKWLKGEVTK